LSCTFTGVHFVCMKISISTASFLPCTRLELPALWLGFSCSPARKNARVLAPSSSTPVSVNLSSLSPPYLLWSLSTMARVRKQRNTTVQGGRLCTVPAKGVPCTFGTTLPLVETMVHGTRGGGVKFEASFPSSSSYFGS
jgi:hypothetical protein